MIRSIRDLQDFSVHATDGNVGKASDFYFDDNAWVIRYLVVGTGDWLKDRQVLISPIAVQTSNWNEHSILVNLTRNQVENSPDIDMHKPVSRQNEMIFHQYYGWPYYWTGAGLWGGGMYPGLLASETPIVVPVNPATENERSQEKPETADTHLRSAREVLGYRIHARDGEIGHISDFLIDDETWRINYMVINTSNWWVGKKVIVPPTWVKKVSWPDQEINVDLARDTIKNSPEFNPETLLNKA